MVWRPIYIYIEQKDTIGNTSRVGGVIGGVTDPQKNSLRFVKNSGYHYKQKSFNRNDIIVFCIRLPIFLKRQSCIIYNFSIMERKLPTDLIEKAYRIQEGQNHPENGAKIQAVTS